jgi:hypothetical protein
MGGFDKRGGGGGVWKGSPLKVLTIQELVVKTKDQDTLPRFPP